MVDNINSQMIRTLLHDPDFVMWCLMPTEELDNKWKQWQEQHTERLLEVKQARTILMSAHLNEYIIPDNVSKELWLRIQQSMKQRDRKRTIFIVRYAAACAVLLLLSVSVFYTWNRNVSENAIASSAIQTDTIPTEVTLIMGGQKVVQVDNNALIAYDSDITVQSVQNKRKVVHDIANNDSSKNVMNTLVVPRGRRSSLLLADGSRVWVNSGSVLRFPSYFKDGQRSIEVEGEIYIEVVKDKTPFQVKTDQFTVNVLGTKFDVSSYSDGQERSVVLVEGSVAVRTCENEQIRLKPNHKLTFMSKTNKNKIETVDVCDHISWKDGVFRFKRETMANILMRLSRNYNIPIKCAPAVSKHRSSGKLVLFNDINQVMETFSMLYNISYRFESDTLYIE